MRFIRESADIDNEKFLKEYTKLGERISQIKHKKVFGDNNDIHEEELSPKIFEKIKNEANRELEFDEKLVKQTVEFIKVINEKFIEITFKTGKVVSERI